MSNLFRNEQKVKTGVTTDIIWVDSDKNVCKSASLLKNAQYNVTFFNETADALNYLRSSDCASIVCIITSMMQRDGRKERGLLSGLDMIDEIRLHWKRVGLSTAPLLAVITVSADKQECNERGIEIIVYGDRTNLQNQIIERLGISTDRSHRRKWDEERSQSCADLRIVAKETLDSLQLHSKYFDNFGDHCFCTKCEPERIYKRGSPLEKYAIPQGWYRYGLVVREEYLKRRAEIETWHVAYHGTKKEIISSILDHNRIMFPGDKLNDGTVLKVRLGQIWADKVDDGKKSVIYLSPTIYYASNFVYAEPFTINGKKCQIVLQCRINPKCYQKFPETLNLKKQLDPQFRNDEIEWVTADRAGVIPYGLLIRQLT